METQQDIGHMAAAIYRDKVLRARETPPEQRLMDGFMLFEDSLAFTEAGVVSQLGLTDEARIMAEVERRLERVRQVHDHGWFKPWPAQAPVS